MKFIGNLKEEVPLLEIKTNDAESAAKIIESDRCWRCGAIMLLIE